MPSVFDISPLSDTVALDDQGRGETTFTVSNHPDRARRGRAHIKVDPGGPVLSNWFTIEDPEREFPAEGVKQVQQFTVKLSVPADKPIKGSFKLVVASVRLPEVPDEHFTVGPSVGFEVRAVEPEGKAPFPWWIVAVGVLALLLAGGLVAWLMWPTSPVVPELVTKTRGEAERLLQDAGLVPGTITEEASDQAAGTVLRTVPRAGRTVEAGSAVDLVISSVADDQPPVRPATIPALEGLPLQEAMARLLDVGMRLNPTFVNAAGDVVQVGRGRGIGLSSGIVMSQTPRSGTPASPEQVVEVVVRIP